jgi:hypothetical protein
MTTSDKNVKGVQFLYEFCKIWAKMFALRAVQFPLSPANSSKLEVRS